MADNFEKPKIPLNAWANDPYYKSIAHIYDPDESYATGSIVLSPLGSLVKAVNDTTGEYNPDDWEETVISDNLGGGGSSELTARVEAIESKIPPQATEENKLADKDFVNSSIATNTAFFRGTYDLVEDLELTEEATEEEIAEALATVITEVTNNDYSFVFYTNAATGITEYYDRYKYSSEDGWAFEFRLNNSSFTAEQWAAISSGITASLVSNLVNGNIPYMTTAPTSANTNGLKIVVLASEPSTKYDGYLYLIKDGN